LVKLQPGVRLFPVDEKESSTIKKRLSRLRTALLTAAAAGGEGVEGGTSDDGVTPDGTQVFKGEAWVDEGRCFTLVCQEEGRVVGFNLEVPVGGNGRSRDEWLQALKECWEEYGAVQQQQEGELREQQQQQHWENVAAAATGAVRA
jgi:hypothetical protein